MKKNIKQSVRAKFPSLGDLIRAVSSFSKNDRETITAVAFLLDSGKVRITSGGRMFRAHVC